VYTLHSRLAAESLWRPTRLATTLMASFAFTKLLSLGLLSEPFLFFLSLSVDCLIVRDIWPLDGLYRRHWFWPCWLSSHHQETSTLRSTACTLPSNVRPTAYTLQYQRDSIIKRTIVYSREQWGALVNKVMNLGAS
jgi:hypothetical protein